MIAELKKLLLKPNLCEVYWIDAVMRTDEEGEFGQKSAGHPLMPLVSAGYPVEVTIDHVKFTHERCIAPGDLKSYRCTLTIPIGWIIGIETPYGVINGPKWNRWSKKIGLKIQRARKKTKPKKKRKRKTRARR